MFKVEHANDRLFDHELARRWKLKKTRALADKRMDLKDAIAKYVDDGDSLIETGFAYARGPLAAYWEIGRQKRKDLAGIHTPGGLNNLWYESSGLEGCHVAYVGVEMRGLIQPFRRGIEAGTPETYSEWSRGGLALALRAAGHGVYFAASKSCSVPKFLKTTPMSKSRKIPGPASRFAWCLPCTLTSPFSLAPREHVRERHDMGFRSTTPP